MNNKKLILLCGILVLAMITLTNLVSAINVTDAHGIAMSTSSSTTAVRGMVISPNSDIDLFGVEKISGDTSTRVIISSVVDGSVILREAGFNGSLNASFNGFRLNSSDTYYILMDAEGGSYTSSKTADSQSFPNSQTNVQWLKGVFNGANDSSDPYWQVKSITSEASENPGITLNNPGNNTNFLIGNITFNSSIQSNGGLIQNISLFIDGIRNQTITDGVNRSREFIVELPFDVGSYNWSIETYDTDGLTNTSFTFFYTIDSIIENSQTFNTTTYETSFETFILNLSAFDTSIVTAELVYNGTNIGNGSGSISSGDSIVFSKQLSVGTLSGASESRNFYWRIYNGTALRNSTTNNQNTVAAILAFCNTTINNPYINFTFKNETTAQEDVNASIVSSWYYWIGNQTENKTLSFSNSTTHRNYAFCFTPSNRTVNAILNIDYDNDEAQQRTFAPTLSLTSTITEQVLYLLPTSLGLFAQFRAEDTLGNVLEGVKAVITRTLGAATVTVSSDFTDSSGIVVFFLNPDVTYTAVFSKSGFTDNTFSFVPITDQRVVIMGGSATTNVTGSEISLNTTYQITPLNSSLNNNTDYTFGFNVTSSQAISLISMNITNSSGFQLGFQSNAGEGFVSEVINTGNLSLIVGEYTIQTANETIKVAKVWVVGDEFIGDYSIFRQLNLFLDYNFEDFVRLLIVVSLITGIVIFMSAGEVTDTSESKVIAVVLLVWIFSFVGWLNNPVVVAETGIAEFSRQYGIAILTTAGGSFFILRRIFT